MKTKQIFWGVFLISIGILILLRNYFDLSIEWGDIWKLWPLIFVLIGANLMLKNDSIKAVLSVFTALLLAFAVYTSVANLFGLVREDIHIRIDDERDYDTSRYSTEFSSEIRSASLDVEAGAGSFILNDTTDLLFDASVEGKRNNYELIENSSDETADLVFTMKSTKFFPGKKNRVDIKLNAAPLWDLNFEIGAAAVDFDLSPYKINNLDISMGAASLKLRLGSINNESRVNIDAGASSIDIDVPENAGCEIRADVSLSSKNFRGFEKVKETLYRTSGFDNANKKIFIQLQSGVSSINVNRYTW
jgi:hypothetical protein